MNDQLVLPEIDNCNWYKFDNDPIAVALVRNEGDCTVLLKEVDDYPSTKEKIVQGQYLDLAYKIRKYYSNKMFMGNFYVGGRFENSNWRNSLRKCLERDDIFCLHHTELGMISKLPEFYIADTIIDEIKLLCDTRNPMQTYITDKTLQVEYLRSTMTRYGPNIQYSHWFRTEDNKAVSFIIKHDNPLVNLFYYSLKYTKIFYLTGNFVCCKADDFYYYDHSGQIAVPD